MYKYKGDDKEKCQILGDFLEGELDVVYKNSGGRKLKYDEMKEKLLKHCRKEKFGGSRYWKKQFKKTKTRSR